MGGILAADIGVRGPFVASKAASCCCTLDELPDLRGRRLLHTEMGAVLSSSSLGTRGRGIQFPGQIPVRVFSVNLGLQKCAPKHKVMCLGQTIERRKPQ